MLSNRNASYIFISGCLGTCKRYFSQFTNRFINLLNKLICYCKTPFFSKVTIDALCICYKPFVDLSRYAIALSVL